ncbi:MAG: DUF3179 domain-containing protein [Flavobacteriaceae bacterium]|nr:DUF3179 domain-containing protein [Flavobacteriaceae bacterium]
MKKTIYFFSIILFITCSKSFEEETAQVTKQNKWVNLEEPYPEGDLGLFPLMNSPIYKTVQEVTNLKENDRVAIVSYQNQVKVYPYLYNNKFEVVNDSIGTYYYAVSYCPQTKSAVNFNRITAQKDTLDLVASGYLYKDNMVPSDKNHQFFWSQMLMQGITNNAVTKNLQTLNLVQTNWKTVVDFFPNAKIFYYKGDIVTPIQTENNATLLRKTTNEVIDADEVFGIVENYNNLSGKEKNIFAFPLKNQQESTTLQKFFIDGKKTLFISNKKRYFYTTLITPNNLTFTLDKNQFPPILTDNEGTKWNAFGYAFEGPRKGQQLASAKSYIASWWAWKDFFKNIELK